MVSLKAGDGNQVFRKRYRSHIKLSLLTQIALPPHGCKVFRGHKPDQAGHKPDTSRTQAGSRRDGGSGKRFKTVAKNSTASTLGALGVQKTL